MERILAGTHAPKRGIVVALAFYFAYGSNLKTARMQSRIARAELRGLSSLGGYRWRCNKRGVDGSAKDNIEVCHGEQVWGVVFGFPETDFPTLDGFEKGYLRIPVEVAVGSERLRAQTYLSERTIRDERPNAAYRAVMVEGAREHALPASFIARLETLRVID